MTSALDRDQVYSRFHDAVNMAPAELEEWLASEQSHKVGFTREGESESIGHASGRRIVTLLRKRKGELDDDDYTHMRKVVGFVRRHGARRPENTVTSRWRYSLMNWGHDPIKEDQ
jgi:hypothetical protein